MLLIAIASGRAPAAPEGRTCHAKTCQKRREERDLGITRHHGGGCMEAVPVFDCLTSELFNDAPRRFAPVDPYALA
jgi:hypothetical protein